MAINLNLDLKHIPQGVWCIVTALILIVLGKVLFLDYLFYLGVIIMGLIGLAIIADILFY